MRSIRRSLIAYFLVLMGLGLGAVSALAYRTAVETLRDKELSRRELLLSQYEDRVREEEERLDQDLLAHARTVASVSQSRVRGYRMRLLPLGLLTSLPSPQGQLTAPLWLAEYYRGPLSYQIFRSVVAEVSFEEDPRQESEPGAPVYYLQITSEWNSTWRSKSLGDAVLPADLTLLSPQRGVVDWQFDTIDVFGRPCRRVSFKSPITRFQMFHSRRPGPPPEPPAEGQRPPEPALTPGAFQFMVIQVAFPTAARDAAVARLVAERDQKLAELEAASEQSLARLRRNLLLVASLTFAAVVFGGSLLIDFGLRSLRRLGDAVGRVNEKDFRLPVEPARLTKELVPIARRLDDTLGQLRRAFEREKQATADISHELRTPLAALTTTLDVTLRKPRPAEEYRETLAECREVTRQMSQMVERILLLARLDAGTVPVREAEGDGTALAASCLPVVRPLAEAAGLRVDLKADGPVPVTTDFDRMREVLTNLLHNAVAYNRPGGRVTLAVKAAPGGGAVFEVADTGVGIAPEHRDRVFERFFRADPSRHATGTHTGLGLAIVRECVHRLGGTVALESEVGVGSTFRVTLPATRNRETDS